MYQIRWIHRTPRFALHERISHIGGVNQFGLPWRLTQEQAIEGIETGRWSFFISRGDSIIGVVVGLHPCGGKYLKTEVDSKHPLLLLSLPDSP